MNLNFFQPVSVSPVLLWITIFIGGLITYGIRLSFILLFSQREIPDWLIRALRYVPPAVLTAIIFPELFIKNGHVDMTYGNGRMIAGVIAILVAWRTKSALLTIVVGMGVLWLMIWIFQL